MLLHKNLLINNLIDSQIKVKVKKLIQIAKRVSAKCTNL